MTEQENVEKPPVHKRHLLAWLDKPWKRVVFAVVIVLLLAAIGAVTYWYVTIKMPGNKVVTEDTSTEDTSTNTATGTTPSSTTPVVPAGTSPTKSTSGSSSNTGGSTPSNNTPAVDPIVITLGNAFADPTPLNVLGGGTVWFYFPVSANKAGTFTYKFVKSNGIQSPTYTGDFAQAGTYNILDSWVFPPSTPVGYRLDGWEQIQILTPTAKQSNQASFSVNAVP